jgi:nucleoside-diphosphate-sugar epimerase
MTAADIFATLMTATDISLFSVPRAGDQLEVFLMRVFVTGASGWIGSAVVPELIGAGHQVVGLGRSDVSAAALTAAGAEVHRGTLDDLDGLRDAASASDGVIHLAFKHDLAFSGDFESAADADRRAVETIGDALDASMLSRACWRVCCRGRGRGIA